MFSMVLFNIDISGRRQLYPNYVFSSPPTSTPPLLPPPPPWLPTTATIMTSLSPCQHSRKTPLSIMHKNLRITATLRGKPISLHNFSPQIRRIRVCIRRYN
ncbi:hypothetical protein Hanom_Chr00s129962g01815031 [Helianthus anomalus]